MLFNSLDFLVFLAVVYPLYFALRRRQRVVLLVASLFFYDHWNPPYLLLIFASVGVDFVAAQRSRVVAEALSPALLDLLPAADAAAR
jgi:D-alanyl-lipoteichoic acid acyltransferase DltB (MBOAT superfamily)